MCNVQRFSFDLFRKWFHIQHHQIKYSSQFSILMIIEKAKGNLVALSWIVHQFECGFGNVIKAINFGFHLMKNRKIFKEKSAPMGLLDPILKSINEEFRLILKHLWSAVRFSMNIILIICRPSSKSNS